jgi:4-amino-4-deoxy-L-arabinose transferase-like glycosyltransferase
LKIVSAETIVALSLKNNAENHVAHKFNIFICLALLIFAIRLTYGPITDLPLFYDEAYYHFWSRHLDWGYFSKPPLVAWLIYTTTQLTHSHSEWAVRLASPLLYFATAYFIYASASFLYNRTTGLYAAAIFYTSPLVTFNSLFISSDAPLLFCWSLAIFCYVHASKNDSWWAWAGLGIAIGFGVLAKYTMLVWLAGFVIYCFWYKTSFRRAFSSNTFLVLIIASVLILPNLIWNWQHDFISFQHTADIAKLEQNLFHPSHLLEFIAGQFLVFGPLSFYLLLHLFWRPSTSHSIEKLLLCLSLPFLLAMALQALLAKANMNWAAPVYVAASIMLARALILGYKYKLAHSLLICNLVIGAIFYLYPQIQQGLNIEPSVRNTPFHRVAGWKPLFQSIPDYLPDFEQQVWLSDSRMLLSYLDFYLPVDEDNAPKIVSFNPEGKIEHQFDLYRELSQSHFSSFIFISESPRQLSECFSEVNLQADIKQAVYPSLERELYLYQVTGFQGYAHCHL